MSSASRSNDSTLNWESGRRKVQGAEVRSQRVESVAAYGCLHFGDFSHAVAELYRSKEMSTEKPILRTTAITAAVVGTIISVGLMLRACRFNDSGIALALIAIWILSPTMALVFADYVATRWPIFGRATVSGLMLVVVLGSVIFYGIDALLLLSPRRGFPYALVPAVSWLLIAIVLVVAALRTHARAKNHVA